MNWFRNRNVQTKLMILFALFALLAASNAIAILTSAVGFQEQLADLRGSSNLLAENAAAREALLKGQLAVKDLLLDPANPAHTGSLRQAWIGFSEFLTGLSAGVYAEDIAAQDEDAIAQARLAAQLQESHAALAAEQQKAADLALEQNAAAVEQDLAVVAPAADLVETQLKAQQNDESIYQEQVINSIDGAVQSNTNLGLSAILLLAVLLVAAVYATNQIAQPLLALTNAITAFENNTFKAAMLAPYLSRQDELGQLARAVSAMATSITESNQLKARYLRAASRFVPTQYLEFLEKQDITQVNLGDNVAAEMAVMFSDIRGFSTLSEKMSAQENFDFVNEYLKLVSPMIEKHDGFIVKFLGDGMMAIFPYGVEDAVQAAIEKQQKVKEFNAMLASRGLPGVSVGIGIHTGPMMVGMIGEEMRMQGDAFSDDVNLTSRLEGLNKFYGTNIIASEDTLRSLPNPTAYEMRYLGRAVVKGRETPLGLYEIYQGLPAEVVNLRVKTQADFDRGIQAYTAGKLEEAQTAFNAVLAVDPNDKTAKYYLERCKEWLGRPLPANWNGVIVMDSK